MQRRTIGRLYPLALLLSALLLLAAACGGDGGKDQTTPPPEATQGTPGEGSSTADATPETPAPDDRLPEDFPEEFPMYPNAGISQAARFGDQVLVTFDTDDSRDDVAAFFRDGLEKPPWEILAEEEFVSEGMVIIRFAHLDEPVSGSVSVITIDADGQTTVITLRITVPESVGTPTPSPQATPTADTDSATPEDGGE